MLLRSEIKAPEWAIPIVELVMAHEGIEIPPTVTWARSRTPVRRLRETDGVFYRSMTGAVSSSGLCDGNQIVIRVGSHEQDARVAFFHELAHWVTEHGHNVVMYAKLFELLWLFGEKGDVDYARKREAAYMPEPAKRGWGRFSSKVACWGERVQYVGERLAAEGC